MNTKRFFIILAVMALLLTLPSVASAQRLPPHVFVGMAMMQDESSAPDGTMVTAWVGGAEVANTTVTGGNYTLIVDQGDQSFAGETITFQVGGMDAMETATWMQGGGDELNLTSSGAMEATMAPEPTAMAPGGTGVPGARGSAGPSGPAGASGAAGARGAAGAKGADGPAGASGPSGSTGPSGSAGNAGSPGPSGPVGPSGAAGPEGSSGSSGALAIVGLILAIIALVGAGGVIVLSRRT